MWWTSNSCGCRLKLSGVTFEDWEKKCELHKGLDGQSLLNDVLKHNRDYNWKFGKSIELTDTQKNEINSDKEKEMRRIKSLGGGVMK